MRHLLWPLGLIVAFGVGLAAGTPFRHGQSAGPEGEDLQAVVTRLRQQIDTLQTRLRARDAALASLHERTRAGGGAAPYRPDPWADTLLPDRAATAVAGDRSAPGPVARAEGQGRGPRGVVTTPLTVEAATQRFRRYVAETNGAGGAGRWWQTREVLDELRAMGPVGAQALLNVLAGDGSSDERRAAAALLGALQEQRALPLLQNILENDNDLLLRRAAAQGLRRLQAPDAVPLMDALLSDSGEDRFVRLSAAYGLAQMDKANGLTGLMQIFNESDADGRGRDLAFRSLVSLNDERSLPFMRQVVTSVGEASYRLQAIQFVEAHGDRQALGVLNLVMQSPTEQPSIRDAAARAYKAISSR